MSAGAAIAGGLGAAGQIAGGFLGAQGGLKAGDIIMPTFNTANSLGLQSSEYDALNLLGFGDIANIPSPLQQLIGQIEALPIDNKTKRRGLNGIVTMMHGKPIDNVRKIETKAVLKRLGMLPKDLPSLIQRNQEFESRMTQLKKQLSPLQDETILNRAQTAQAASQLLGDAGRFTQGAPASSYQTAIMDMLNRNINDQEEQLMLRAQFGGFNPAAGLEGIGRMRQDTEMTALQQAIAAATALTAGLNAGNTQAQQASGLTANATLNSMGIAAQQAQAANQLAQQSSINKWDSIANGVSGASNMLGAAGILGMMGGGSSAPSTFGQMGGPGSTANQYATMNSQYGGWNPVVNF